MTKNCTNYLFNNKIMNKILLLLFAVFAYAGSVQAQDTAGSTSTGVMNNSNTATISYNNTAGSNKLPVVSIAAQQPGAVVTGVTYNGQPLQQFNNYSDNSRIIVDILYKYNISGLAKIRRNA
jgi:hypothetical protein